jgi:hypothetical protein
VLAQSDNHACQHTGNGVMRAVTGNHVGAHRRWIARRHFSSLRSVGTPPL